MGWIFITMPRLADPFIQHPSLAFRYGIISSKMPLAALYAKTATLPSMTQNAITAYHGNDSMKVKGRTTWNPITFNCYTFEGITVNELWKYIKLHHLVPDAIDMDAVVYKHDITMLLLAPDGARPTQIWSVKDAFITDVQFGETDWGSDEIINVTLTMEYDWAEKIV